MIFANFEEGRVIGISRFVKQEENMVPSSNSTVEYLLASEERNPK